MSVIKAEDSCANMGGHLFFPDSPEEFEWVISTHGYAFLSALYDYVNMSVQFRNGKSNLLLGLRDYIGEEQNLIAMDYSRKIGFRPLTRNDLVHLFVLP